MLWPLDVPIGLRYGKIVKEKVTTLDPTTLFYALVNAIKELAARVRTT